MVPEKEAEFQSLNLHMRRLSSTQTLFLKRIFPIVCFGVIGLAFVRTLAGAVTQQIDLRMLLTLPAMAIFGYFLMRILIWDLVDEVWDDGDCLIIRNKGQDERINLLDIVKVTNSVFTNPPRITLTLREPCAFGKTITFWPPRKIFEFGTPLLVYELRVRIEARRANA